MGRPGRPHRGLIPGPYCPAEQIDGYLRSVGPSRRWSLRNHLYPAFGDLDLIDVDETAIRRWRKARL
jgi:hypothetical protein